MRAGDGDKTGTGWLGTGGGEALQTGDKVGGGCDNGHVMERARVLATKSKARDGTDEKSTGAASMLAAKSVSDVSVSGTGGEGAL